MREKEAVKKIARIGMVLFVIGLVTTFLALFSYIDLRTMGSIIAMSTGVVITSIGYAFMSLLVYRKKGDEEEKHNYKHKSILKTV